MASGHAGRVPVAFKFPQAISHDKRLSNAEPETVLFLEMLDTLSKRTGPAFL